MASVDDDRAFLASLSQHPGRLGDTAYLNPLFVTKMAAAIRQARAQGLNVGVESGFREPWQTGSRYDREGDSSHSYGAAIDVNGIGQPGSQTARQWYNIAMANGIYNPYFSDDSNNKEWNHYQLTSQPLEKYQGAVDALKTARATGDWNKVYAAMPGADTTADRPSGFNLPQQMYDYLTGRGVAPEAARGAIISMMGESGRGLDPTSYNPNDPGGSLGYAQWNGPRRAAMEWMSKHAGLDPQTQPAQFNYWKAELEGTPGAVNYSSVVDALKNAKTAEEGNSIWTRQYEAPKIDNSAQRFAGNDKNINVSNGVVTVSAAAAAPAASSAPTLSQALRSGDVGGALAALTKKDGDKTSPLDSIIATHEARSKAQAEQAQQTAEASQRGMVQAPQDTGQALYGPAEQLWQGTMQTYGQPLSWTNAPPGHIAGQQYAQGLPAAGQVAPPQGSSSYLGIPMGLGMIPGTTLNSLGSY
jgi:hypothetical protein